MAVVSFPAEYVFGVWRTSPGTSDIPEEVTDVFSNTFIGFDLANQFWSKCTCIVFIFRLLKVRGWFGKAVEFLPRYLSTPGVICEPIYRTRRYTQCLCLSVSPKPLHL